MNCCPLSSSDDGDRPGFCNSTLRVARKPHKCTECGEAIAAGMRHEITTGKWGDEISTFRTCLSCREIRNHFGCEGWVFGQLWEDLEENFFPDMKAGGPCMDGLSSAAKSRLFDERLKWLFESQ